MIFRDSRYATGTITKEYKPNKEMWEVTVYRNFTDERARFFFYVWKEKDRIDLIAGEFLGGTDLWWKIMDFNPEHLNPFDIPVGSTLRIPYV